MAVKTKKKNKYAPLIGLLIAFVVFFAIYKALCASNERKAAEEAAAEAAENADIMIAEYDYTTMTSLSYEKKGSDKLSFAVSGSSWIYVPDEHFPLNNTTIANMASAIAQIAVECTVDEGEAADYGLDDPEYIINVKYSDGDSHEYKIGNYNSFNSSYYFMADGEMYMVASGLLSYFDYTLDDLMSLDTIPSSDWSDTAYVNYITVKDGENENKIEDDTGKSELVDLLGSLYLNDCADYYTEEEEKANYGLDGSCSITVNYKKAKTTTDSSGNESTTYLDANYVLTIGKTDGGYYIMPTGSNIAYNLSDEDAENILAYIDYVPTVTEETTEEL